MSDYAESYRRVMRAIVDATPDPPAIGSPFQATNSGRGATRSSLRGPLTAVGTAFAVLVVFGVSLVAVVAVRSGDDSSTLLSQPGATATAPAESVPPPVPTTQEQTDETIPIDGQPEALGVEQVDFVPAALPTTPEEIRVTAAWDAIRYNVETSWTEECMRQQGFALDIPRITASMMRRNAEMPDFEMDAQFGLDLFVDEASLVEPGPPEDASESERAAWEAAYLSCSNETERRRSEGFDQILGSIPPWMDIVRDVNNSDELAEATAQMLRCIAEGGGPVVDTIRDLYGAFDSYLLNAEDPSEFDSIAKPLLDLNTRCAGDYNDAKRELLVPRRDQILRDYASELAEAEQYFASVLGQAGLGS